MPNISTKFHLKRGSKDGMNVERRHMKSISSYVLVRPSVFLRVSS